MSGSHLGSSSLHSLELLGAEWMNFEGINNQLLGNQSILIIDRDAWKGSELPTTTHFPRFSRVPKDIELHDFWMFFYI